MNTQQLHCFLCVADKLNFTKAAEELHLSTPTVTHHIQKLEEELNTKLFVRSPKMVRLTETGTVFYSDAREILMKLELAKKHMDETCARNLKFIRIGCTSYTELERLIPLLSGLKKEFPNVYPQLIVNDYFQLLGLFQNNQLDVMLSTRDMVKDIKNCTFKKLKTLTSYALVPADSPLANHSAISFDDLAGSCLITLHPRFVPFQYGNKLQENITLHAQQHFDISPSNDLEGIALAEAGYGIAIMPEYCIPSNLGNTIVVPLVEQENTEYGIACHARVKESYVKFFMQNFVF